jgi:hypothetical protein
MATWRHIDKAAPGLAAAVRSAFDAHVNKTIATVRKDGAPRISGIEATFVGNDVCFGSMPGALKALDLLRDPRFAMHSGTADPPADMSTWAGDAKIAGRAIEITDPVEIGKVIRANLAAARDRSGGTDHANGDEPDFSGSHFFRADIAEIVLTRLNDAGDALVIESWTERRGLWRVERS